MDELPGVIWSEKKQKWDVYYSFNGLELYVGEFEKKEEAMEAREYIEHNPNAIIAGV